MTKYNVSYTFEGEESRYPVVAGWRSFDVATPGGGLVRNSLPADAVIEEVVPAMEPGWYRSKNPCQNDAVYSFSADEIASEDYDPDQWIRMKDPEEYTETKYPNGYYLSSDKYLYRLDEGKWTLKYRYTDEWTSSQLSDTPDDSGNDELLAGLVYLGAVRPEGL